MPSKTSRGSISRLFHGCSFLLVLLFVYVAWSISLEVQPEKHYYSQLDLASLFEGQSINNHGESQSSTNKPRFIIHLGPPKTGTTFLQSSLCSSNGPGFFLQQDNWSYLGTCSKRNKKGFMGHSIRAFFEDLPNTKLRKGFVQKVMKNSRKESNVLLIFEGFWRLTDGQILELQRLLEPLFHVQMIAAYRPLYEYLPSKYNSISKPSRNPSARAWPGELTPTKNVTGQVLLPFDLYNRGDFTKEFVKPLETSKLHVAHSSILAFQKHGFEGQVIDFRASSRHLKGGIMEDIICNLLNATYSCNALKTGAWKPNGAKNPSVSFDGDIIAVAAHKAGLIPSNTTRQDAKRLCDTFYERVVSTHQLAANGTNDTQPVKCLPKETLNHLFELSWETHCKLFCDNTTDLKSERGRHREGFEESKDKFCYADAERIIQDPAFISYIKDAIQNTPATTRKDQPELPLQRKPSGGVRQGNKMMKKRKRPKA